MRERRSRPQLMREPLGRCEEIPPGGSMKRRLAQKRLRTHERMLSNACRLYITRPGAGSEKDSYESLARSIVQLQLSFLLWEQARVGLADLRGYRADEVKVSSIEASANGVHGLGTVSLERSMGGAKQVRAAPFRFHCAVPSRWKTYRGGPRPNVSLLTDTGTA